MLGLHHSTACKTEELTTTIQPGLHHTAMKWPFLAIESLFFGLFARVRACAPTPCTMYHVYARRKRSTQICKCTGCAPTDFLFIATIADLILIKTHTHIYTHTDECTPHIHTCIYTHTYIHKQFFPLLPEMHASQKHTPWFESWW